MKYKNACIVYRAAWSLLRICSANNIGWHGELLCCRSRWFRCVWGWEQHFRVVRKKFWKSLCVV